MERYTMSTTSCTMAMVLLIACLCQAVVVASVKDGIWENQFADLPPFPLEDVVAQAQAFAYSATPPAHAGIVCDDYLTVLSTTVDHFRQFQNKNKSSVQYGRIIDPYANMEIQYSTPTFAFAGATLVASGYYNQSYTASLLEDVSLAMTAALTALQFGQPIGDQGCAQGHCNFYTMPLMLAMETLNGSVSKLQFEQWESITRSIDPYKAYKSWPHAAGNWAIVALTGEFLRYKLGYRDNITDIVEQLANQYNPTYYTANGQYQDHSGCSGVCNPMPYDHFPRKYLAVMLGYGYNSTNATMYWELNRRAAWVSLLMQSPFGELPTGGRSSQHQWNEAVSCVTYEFWASRLSMQGDKQGAGVFKRAATLSLRSLKRWKRRTGEWFILKNRFSPDQRYGYETYSYYSQYNLLPASMLATAHKYCRDSIVQLQSFAEVGGFLFSPEGFHKVIANADGMYVETELFPDAPPHDSAGLARVHTRGTDPLITLTASAPQQCEGTPAGPGALAPGVMWSVKERIHADVVREFPSYDPSRFRVQNILWASNPNDDQSTLYLLPKGVTGNFTLDFGEVFQLSSLNLTNTHNSHYNDFGTKDFALYASNSSDPTTFQHVLSSRLKPVTGKVSPQVFTFPSLSTRFVQVALLSYYATGAGLNSIAFPGVPAHATQNVTNQTLAAISFGSIQASLLPQATIKQQQAVYRIQYNLTSQSSAVSSILETYNVTGASVVVTSMLVPKSSDVSQVGIRIPVFAFDGERNTTYHISGSQILVSLPGDATSALPTTCVRFDLIGEASGASFQLTDKVYYARNGFMREAVYVKPITAESTPTITFAITPLGNCSSFSP
eukprot:m.204129 g.204129  ORF g.204129 m.204129 type:complete len:838 (+) comp15006_c0_seq5:63-2576(+)